MAHLIFQTAFPGDLFLSIPLLKRVRAWDPHSEVVLACRPGLGEFFLEFGLCDKIVTVDKRAADGGRTALRELRNKSWDHIFVPHESVRTVLWMMRLQAKRKIGFHRWWNRMAFDLRVVKPVQYPDALRQLSLLTAVDDTLAELFAESEVQELRSPDSQATFFDFSRPEIPPWASMKLLSGGGSVDRKVVFLAPGSVWNTKRWSKSGFEQVGRMLLDKGYEVELVGSHTDREICGEIAAKLGILNRAGHTTLGELVKLLNGGVALITNDSGAMHAASAADIPTVAIFGPTTLDLGYRPWQNKAIVVQKNLKCRPCGKHGHHVCPIKTHACMESISAIDVMSAFHKLVAERTIQLNPAH